MWLWLLKASRSLRRARSVRVHAGVPVPWRNPHTAALSSLRSRLQIPDSQLQSKYKHAGDLGVHGNRNKATLAQFERAITAHVHNPNTVVVLGRYRRADRDVIHFVDPSTGRLVMTDRDGTFITCWILSPTRIEHVLTHGEL